MAARSRYSHVAIALHWLIALLIVGNLAGGLAVGGFLESPDPAMKRTGFTVIQLHKSVGLTVLALSLLRLAWRLVNPAPPLPGHMTPLEHMLARLSHWGFYALIILLPLSGWALISASEIRYPTFWFGLFAVPFLPLAQGKAIGHQLLEVHELLAFATIALLGLHVLAALKHHYFDRDDVLARMAPWSDGADERRRMIRVVAALLLAAAAPAAAANWTVDPARSRLGFTATWLGKPVEGSFKAWTARIAFDPAAPSAARIDVTVDLASAATGDRTVDGALPDKDWFAAGRGAQARFVATSVRKTPGGWLAAGTLSLKGRTAPVELPFTLAIAGDTASVSGSARVDRRTWQIGLGSDAAGDYVDFPVAIRLALVARRAP